MSSENMSTRSQEPEEFSEDKKCRICGFADTKNVHIFSNSNKSLVTKILTVYPFIMYENDPLPKNICKKCICNVSIMYSDVMRVAKMQTKWIKNVRSVQPEHNYIQVLKLIESANIETKNSLERLFGEEVHDLIVARLSLLPKAEIVSSKEASSTLSLQAETILELKQDSSKSNSMNSFSIDYDENSIKQPVRNTELNTSKSAKIKEMKSILELNGCSLTHLSPQQKAADQLEPPPKICWNSFERKIGSTTIKIRRNATQTQMTDDAILLSILSSPSSSNVVSDANCDCTENMQVPKTRCSLCDLQFKSLFELATHQLVHLRIRATKIFQKKYLQKRLRRGRLINLEGRKCIRCLNCWRIFVDNKAILEHWAMGECDFYCQICGKEYAQTPRMLREHVPAAHGINYKSSKCRQRAQFTYKTLKTSEEKTDEESQKEKKIKFRLESATESQRTASVAQTIASLNKSREDSQASTMPSNFSTSQKKSSVIYNDDGSVSCHICLNSFQNLKARNSHMRKHKPSYAYGDMVMPAFTAMDAYVKQEVAENENNSMPLKCQQPGGYNYTTSDLLDSASQQSLLFSSENQSTKDILLNAVSQTDFEKTKYIFQNPKCTTSENLPQSTSLSKNPTTQIRGVRTKFVTRRSDLNSTAISSLKVKSLNELQEQKSTYRIQTSSSCNSWTKPSISDTTTINTSPKTNVAIIPVASHIVIPIKSEPMEIDAAESRETLSPEPLFQATEREFVCISCGSQFETKQSLFQHKNSCLETQYFSCEFCPRKFSRNDDYKMHVAQLHGNQHFQIPR